MARRVIETEGAESLNVRRVAQEIGVTHGALYRHFDNRDGLLDAVSAEWLTALAADTAAAVDLTDYVRIYVERAIRGEHLYRCVFDTARRPDADGTRAALAEVRRSAATVFATSVGAEGDALRDGVLRLWATLHGMIDLYWRGLVRARSATAAVTYITEQAIGGVGVGVRRGRTDRGA